MNLWQGNVDPRGKKAQVEKRIEQFPEDYNLNWVGNDWFKKSRSFGQGALKQALDYKPHTYYGVPHYIQSLPSGWERAAPLSSAWSSAMYNKHIPNPAKNPAVYPWNIYGGGPTSAQPNTVASAPLQRSWGATSGKGGPYISNPWGNASGWYAPVSTGNWTPPEARQLEQRSKDLLNRLNYLSGERSKEENKQTQFTTRLLADLQALAGGSVGTAIQDPTAELLAAARGDLGGIGTRLTDFTSRLDFNRSPYQQLIDAQLGNLTQAEETRAAAIAEAAEQERLRQQAQDIVDQQTADLLASEEGQALQEEQTRQAPLLQATIRQIQEQQRQREENKALQRQQAAAAGRPRSSEELMYRYAGGLPLFGGFSEAALQNMYGNIGGTFSAALGGF